MASRVILLVDDDADDRDVLDDAMQEINVPVTMDFAENGIQALEKLDEWHKDGQLPSLIVLDLNMPKMGGIETLQNLKGDERFKSIPTIIYSTSINPRERDKCILLGAYSFITKPISTREIMDTANTLVDICNTAD